MRRPFRRAFHVTAAVSAVLLAGVCALWVRSYRQKGPVSDAMTFALPPHGPVWRATSVGGRLVVSNEPQRDLESRQHDEYVRTEAETLTRVVKEVGEQMRAVQDRFGRMDRRDERSRRELMDTIQRVVRMDAEQQLRFSKAAGSPRYRSPPRRHSVPDAVVAGLLAVLPITWLLRRVARARRERAERRRGLCSACGYDLTGNISGRCSECGAPVKARVTG